MNREIFDESVANITVGSLILLLQLCFLPLYLKILLILNIIYTDIPKNDGSLFGGRRSPVKVYVDIKGAVATLKVPLRQFGAKRSQIRFLGLGDAEEVECRMGSSSP